MASSEACYPVRGIKPRTFIHAKHVLFRNAFYILWAHGNRMMSVDKVILYRIVCIYFYTWKFQPL